MKVAVVCPYAFDAHGGVQDQVARIVAWLGAAGHDAWAVAPGSGGPDGTRHVGRYRSIPANRSRAPISLDLRMRARVAAAVDDADVVHVHEPFMPMVSLGAVLADTPPKVGTFHADPGRVARASYRGLSPLFRRLAGRLAAVTAVSAVAADAIRHFAEPAIVPNGIDLEHYSADVARIPGRVVFVGRDDARKGLPVLREAWQGIRSRRSDASLHVVGSAGPDGDGISYLGRLSETAKVAELAAATAMAAPNLGGESFGIVVLEGLAAGCAVVASDLPAFRAVAGDAARYVPAGDAAALASAVADLLADEGASRALAERGRERAHRFGRDEVLAGYVNAYEAALARS